MAVSHRFSDSSYPVHFTKYCSSPRHDTVLPDSLDFVHFFTIDFDGWSFIVESVASVAPEEVDVKNVMKSA